MNPVLILTHNNLDLTKRCVESVRKQDVGTYVCLYDNDSTDGTIAWLDGAASSSWFGWHSEHENRGVSKGWNWGLTHLFSDLNYPYVLVIGNDTVLAPWTYSALLSADVPFVTGADVGMNPLPEKPEILPLTVAPDFSCFLIRREVWDKVGRFDERLVHYCGDCDYAVRAHRLGIPLWKANVPYSHERSSTMNRATPEERTKIQIQANMDRTVFQSIYNCLPGTPEYGKLFE